MTTKLPPEQNLLPPETFAWLMDEGDGCLWCGMSMQVQLHDGYRMHLTADHSLVFCMQDTPATPRRRQ